MISKWFNLKEKAIELRLKGLSIRRIEKQLQIPRSTLSGWLRNIVISPRHKKNLLKNWRYALVEARKKAVLWHNREKEKRIQKAKIDADEILNNIDIDNKFILELTLALLYLGEGSKKNDDTAIGNSDPLILKFFIVMLKKLYDVDSRKIRCQLNLRADQDPEKMKLYWSKELKIPLSQFVHVALDKRTIGSKTYHDYKGVCQVRCGNVAIKRKLIHLGNTYCKKVSERFLSM